MIDRKPLNFEVPLLALPQISVFCILTSSNCAFENDLLKNKTKNSNNMHFCVPMHCDAMKTLLCEKKDDYFSI